MMVYHLLTSLKLLSNEGVKLVVFPIIIFLSYLIAPGEVYTVLQVLARYIPSFGWTYSETIQVFQVISCCWFWYWLVYLTTFTKPHNLYLLLNTIMVYLAVGMFIISNQGHLYGGIHDFLYRNSLVIHSRSIVLSLIVLGVYSFYLIDILIFACVQTTKKLIPYKK